jgi:hypothetical protein
MKMLKRLLIGISGILFILSLLLFILICITTWVPFGMKVADWWIDNTIDRFSNYCDKLADELWDAEYLIKNDSK